MAPNQPVGPRSSGRSVGLLAIASLVGAGSLLLVVAVVLARSTPAADYGTDYRFYLALARRALDGDFYLPHQLNGPYPLEVMVDSLYPPAAVFLFVPFLVLPAILWWVIPIAITGYVIWRLRPSAAALAVMFLLLSWPRAIGAYFFGNSDIWVAAFVAAGLRWGWPAVALLIKPTFVPFALVAVRRRSFWVAVAVVALADLALLPMWLDYIRAIRDARIGSDYSIGSLPLVVIPVVAWLGREKTSRDGPRRAPFTRPGSRTPDAAGSTPIEGGRP
jgi:hypothetical protein